MAPNSETWAFRTILGKPAPVPGFFVEMLRHAQQSDYSKATRVDATMSPKGTGLFRNGQCQETRSIGLNARAGLEAVAKDPRKPYTGIITEGDRRYFKAYLRTGQSPWPVSRAITVMS